MPILFDALGYETSAANMVATPAPFDAVAVGGTTTVAGSNSAPLVGVQSMLITFGNNRVGRGIKTVTIPPGQDVVRLTSLVKWTGFTQAAGTYIELLRLLTGAGTAFAEVRLRETGGNLVLQGALQNANVQTGLSAAPAVNTTHTIAIEFYHRGSNDVANVWLNGVLILTATDTGNRFAFGAGTTMQVVVGDQVGSGNPTGGSVLRFDSTIAEAWSTSGAGARACASDMLGGGLCGIPALV